MRMTLTSPALLAADTETRRLRGVAIPYGVFGNTSAGRVCVDAGAVAIPENLRTVKLFTEHGRQTPTGFTVQADDQDDTLSMEFSVARTSAGDQALLEASEGVRDALSVELDNITIEAGHVTAADLVAVAQVALPAFSGAQLVATLTDDEQANVNDLATQIVDATAPAEPSTPPAAATTTEQEPSMTETTAAAAPAAVSMIPAAPARRDPDAERHLWASQAAEIMRAGLDAGQVNAALTDITPSGTGSGDSLMRPAWLDKLWSPQAADRPLINAIGVSPLTSMKIQGWKWGTKPTVAPYAGEKTAVPSSAATITPVEKVAQRIAGAWDIDQIYVDFNTGFVEAFLAAATQDYRKKSQTYLIDGHAAITGPPAIPAYVGLVGDATALGALADVPKALAALSGFLAGNGARTSFVVMASDVFKGFLGMSSAGVPWWVQGQGSVSFDGSTTLAGTTIVVDPAMAAGTALAGDRDAVTFYETGPIRVQAVNLPNGGVDFGLFGYYGHITHDAKGLASCTVTTVGTEEADTEPAAKKKA